MLIRWGLRCSLLYRNVFILVIPEGIQLDRYSLPVWEAPRCHSRLLGQCRLHPRGLTALPYQAHGLLQCLKGQLVLQTGSTHTSWQLSSLRCPGQDLHIWGVRSRWVHESRRWNFSHCSWLWDWILKSIWSWCFFMCSCRQLCSGPFRVLWYKNRVLAGQTQHADGSLQPRLSGGQRAHLCLWRNSGQQRVRQSSQQLWSLRPQHTAVSRSLVKKTKEIPLQLRKWNKCLSVLRWRELCGMREARKNHGLVVVNNRIYAVGGQGAIGTVHSSTNNTNQVCTIIQPHLFSRWTGFCGILWYRHQRVANRRSDALARRDCEVCSGWWCHLCAGRVPRCRTARTCLRVPQWYRQVKRAHTYQKGSL